MIRRRIAVSAALCGTAALAACIAAGLAGFNMPGTETTMAPVEDGSSTYVMARADVSPAPQTDPPPEDGLQAVAADGDPLTYASDSGAALSDPRSALPPETPPVELAALSAPFPVHHGTAAP